jgi:hypothetical protein
MVAHRLRAHGIEPSSVEWDSWRRPDGSWTVAARFVAKKDGTAGIGEEPPALWTFSPARKSLQNANRWAQQLSELEPLDGLVPARRLTAVSDRPFDFETDAEAAARHSNGPHSGPHTGPHAVPSAGKDADGLLDMLRSRRGQRLGVDEDADDALALLLTHGVPAAHPRPSEVQPEPEPQEAAPADAGAEPDAPAALADPLTRRRDARPSMLSRLSLIPLHKEEDDNDVLKLHDGVSTETREVTIVASPARPAGQGTPPAAAQQDVVQTENTGQAGKTAHTGASFGLEELLGGRNPRRANDDSAPATRTERDADVPERQPSKPKRSSIPSWDEIVFGTRGD